MINDHICKKYNGKQWAAKHVCITFNENCKYETKKVPAGTASFMSFSEEYDYRLPICLAVLIQTNI